MLPAAAMLLLWVLAWRRSDLLGIAGMTRRGALVVSFAAFQVLLVLITEGTSEGHHLTRAWVAAAWLVVDALLAAALRRELVAARVGARTALARLLDRTWTARVDDTLLGGAAVAGVFVVLAVIGWLYRPNNSDSMVYHLARTEHWIQNQSVHTFATHYLAQVELGPLNSYNFVHLHLLTGGDRLDGYLQLLATAVCVLGTSELARRLGLGARGQVFAAVLCVTIPNVVLEATSTTNNNLAAAVGVALVTILTSPMNGSWLRRAAAIGGVTALVVLVKGTVIALLGPVGALLFTLGLRRHWRDVGARRAIVRAAAGACLAGVVVLVIAGPFVARNYEMFDKPTGSVSASTISTGLTLRAATGNVVRSTSYEFAVSNQLFPGPVSRALLDPMERAYNVLDLDPSDQRYLAGSNPDGFHVHHAGVMARTEAYGANPTQVILIVLALASLLVRWARGSRELAAPAAIAVSICLGYLAFTGIGRWSTFANRYYVPALVLWCPLIALAMRPMPRTVARAVATLVLLGCLPQLVDNSARSLVHPRYAAVFTLAPYFESMDIRGLPLSSGWGFERDQRAQTQSYEAAVGTITGSACRRVAIANWIRVEYPLWAGLRRADWAGTMNDIGVANESSRYQVPDFFPCALIRQQQPGYVSADEGMAAFQFGQLALSFAPEALGTAPSPPGFLGAGGVAIYPGSGWALGSDGPSGLVDGATVFVCSPVSGTVDLEFELGPSAGAGSVTSPLASRVITKAGNVTLRLQLPAGRSEIPVVVKGGRAKKLDVRQVRAAPGAAKGPP